jgi:hypothetical protein
MSATRRLASLVAAGLCLGLGACKSHQQDPPPNGGGGDEPQTRASFENLIPVETPSQSNVYVVDLGRTFDSTKIRSFWFSFDTAEMEARSSSNGSRSFDTIEFTEDNHRLVRSQRVFASEPPTGKLVKGTRMNRIETEEVFRFGASDSDFAAGAGVISHGKLWIKLHTVDRHRPNAGRVAVVVDLSP